MTKAERVEKFRVWLKALRSGKYKQSRGYFHGRNGGHCCLGVGQIVLGLPKEESSRRLSKLLGFGFFGDDIGYLIGLNDHDHRSFAYIADRIEKKILPRFLTKSA